MKILIASSDNGFYNSQTVFSRKLLLLLKEKSNRIHLLFDLPSASHLGDFDELKEKGIHTHNIKLKHFKNISEFIRSLKEIRKIVSEQKFDTIFCVDSRILDLMILALPFVKTPIMIRSNKSGRIDPFARLKYLKRKVRFIIAPNLTIYNKLLSRDKIPAQKVIRIYDGILRNINFNENESDLSTETNINKLIVGIDSQGLREHKLELYIKAFCDLAENFPNLQFRISGLFQGHPLSYLIPQTLINRFNFIDRSPSYFEIFKGLDIFVSPEINQRGINTTCVFAAARGAALVGFDVGSNAGLIIPGETGWLIEKYNFKQILSSLSEAVKSKEMVKKMGDSAQKMAQNNFTEEVMIGHYQELLDRIGEQE